MRLKVYTTTIMAALLVAPAQAQEHVEIESPSQQSGIGIVAVVDDQVISSVDLTDRIALVLATTGIPDTPEARAHIVPQILRQLVDEKLQMAEAARDGISVPDPKLKEGIARIEKQSGKPPGSLEAFMDERKVSKLSLYAQVRAQVAWSEIVYKKIRPRIKISDQEVARYLERKQAAVVTPVKANEGKSEGKLKEVLITAIHLPVDAPKNEVNIHKLADKLAGEIRAGARFEAVASQFSSSSGGTKATAPFWVEVAQVDPAIAQALVRTPKGGITDPVRTATGYQIIKLVDERRGPATESASPVPAVAPAMQEARAELAFKQILMSLKPDSKPKEAQVLLTLAKEVQKSPGKCEEKSMAGAGDLADLDFRVTLTRALSSDLPEKLRDFLLKLDVGKASDPVITPQGIRLFMLCERIDLPPVKTANVTEKEDDARQAIYAEKMELEAQKFMRNLRREAFIEVRMHQ